MRIILGILLIIIITGCNVNGKSNDEFENIIASPHTDSISPFIIGFPKHPKIGEGAKFLWVKDSIHYVLIVERTDDSTINFRTDSDLENTEMYYGTALLNKEVGTIQEKSIITGNLYRSYEFIEVKDSVCYKIRLGIDSIGSEDRMLVRFIKIDDNIIAIDVNETN